MNLKSKVTVIFFLSIVLLITAHLQAQGTKDDYSRAEKFLPQNLSKLAFKLWVSPQWLEDSSKFWYRIDTREGKEFIFVDPEKGIKNKAFDHEKLAKALAEKTGKEVEANKLPFDSIEFGDELKTISFDFEKKKWQCDLSTHEVTTVDEPERDRYESYSPDGKWIAFVKDYNLFIRSADGTVEIPVTTDGAKDHYYGQSVPNARQMVAQKTMNPKQNVAVIWSPGSRKFLYYRVDSRDARRLHFIQAVLPKDIGAKLYSFVYPLPGDLNVPTAELYIFDVASRRSVKIDHKPLHILYYGGPWPMPWWLDDTRMIYDYAQRGWQKITVKSFSADSGAVKDLFVESTDTFIDVWGRDRRTMNENKEILWTSNRDGWNHLYRYDTTDGTLLNQVTKGEWVVRGILHTDDEAGHVYFSGSGKEPGRDPYLQHLYRVDYDGSNLVLLTPEDAEHRVFISPDAKYFVDTFSRTNTVPKTVLRRCSDGELVMELESADIELLLETGWKFPEPFQVKARDGKTDIYGLIYRPSNFDPSKKYPVIDNVYTGPHTFQTPKSFNRMLRLHCMSIAELGFIVVNIDGFGTAKRSKAFHDHANKNLADGGFPDHIAGFKQLAKKYPYMDIDRVGIFGFSAGGYDTAHAMFAHSDFYKVGVAASGNYDHRMDKAWWNEIWMGFPLGDHYIEQSCLTIAHQLKGKLFLAHGELDENVNPYNTIRLVDALMKANKDFDLLIVPNAHHYLGNNPYFIRKRWDFFTRHLHGVEPVEGYKIAEF